MTFSYDTYVSPASTSPNVPASNPLFTSSSLLFFKVAEVYGISGLLCEPG